MRKVLIVEDDNLLANDLSDELKDLGYEVLGCAENDKEAHAILQKGFPDVILMDIELNGGKDGVELAEEINEIATVPVVYLTDRTDNRTINRVLKGQEGIYLNKPITNYKLLEVNIEQAIRKKADASEVKRHSKYVFLNQKNGVKESVELSSVLTVEGEGTYSNFYTEDGKKFTTSKNLKTILDDLPENFIRVHKSYIVNIDQVESIQDKELVMRKTKKVVKTSKTYFDNLKKHIPSF